MGYSTCVKSSTFTAGSLTTGSAGSGKTGSVVTGAVPSSGKAIELAADDVSTDEEAAASTLLSTVSALLGEVSSVLVLELEDSLTTSSAIGSDSAEEDEAAAAVTER